MKFLDNQIVYHRDSGNYYIVNFKIHGTCYNTTRVIFSKANIMLACDFGVVHIFHENQLYWVSEPVFIECMKVLIKDIGCKFENTFESNPVKPLQSFIYCSKLILEKLQNLRKILKIDISFDEDPY